MKILIADDHAYNRDLLGFILTDEDHECVEADNGQEAVDLVNNNHDIDIVLMDVNMPILDGISAAKTIKEGLGERFLPIIFVTALDNADVVARCLDAGGDDFIPKPVNENVLLAKVNAHARSQALYNSIQEANAKLKYHQQMMEREHAIVEHVFANGAARVTTDCTNIVKYSSPVSMFNGDVLLEAPSPSGGVYLLMGDFTGHGLAAAVGSLPVTEIFYSRVAQQWGIAAIATEINRRLYELLPRSMFFCCSMISLDAAGTQLMLWSGGMNDIKIVSPENEVSDIIAEHMPLGILAPEEFEDEVQSLSLPEGSRIYIYTDGVNEAQDDNGEMFGLDRINDIIINHPTGTVEEIKKAVHEFESGIEQADDISIAEITTGRLQHVDRHSGEKVDVGAEYHTAHSFPWYVYMRFESSDLKSTSISDQLMAFIASIRGIELHKEKIFTIVSELYSNALEHGVLRLDSQLKQSADGFEQYYKLREQRLQQIDTDFIELSVEYLRGSPNKLRLTMTDSGDGFDISNKNEALETNEEIHGRGVGLVNQLCSSLQYSNGGRTVTALYDLQQDNL